MVKPPISNPSASLDEKKQSPSAHSVPNSTTTVAADNDDPDIRTKRFSRDFASFNEKHSPERLFANRNSASPQFTNSFDIDLESGKHVDARPTHLKVPRTTTVHSNASSPAVIGSPHEHRGFGFDDDEEDEIDLGVPRAPGGGGPIERGRPRRRNRRNPAGPPMGLRRAQSLPSHPAMTAPPPIQGLQPSMVQTLNKLLEPERKLAPPPNLRVSLYNIATYSWLNVMLVFVPIAWGAHFAHLTDTVIFVFSFLGIVPLAALLGFATEELALRVGQTLGGLLNATFGNAVELIIAILALVKGELRVVQASMLGSILSNCLLVLGMCFFAGGFRFHEQGYGIRAAQLNISLLSISVFSIVIPAAFNSSLNFGDEQASSGHQDQNKTDRAVLAISRGTSIILLFVYAAYLVFQLWTHAYIYSKEASAYHSAMTHQAGGVDGPTAPPGTRVFRMPHLPSLPSLTIHGHSDTSSSRRSSRRSSSSSTSSSSSSSSSSNTREEEEHQKLKPIVAFALLIVVTVLTGLTAEYLVDSISGLTATGDISREFIALILLPLVGNAAEHVTAVTVSVKNKLDLAITVAVGSSIQIALFVIPFLVLLGWIIGQPLSLFFDIYETVVVFVSILVVNYAISDGKTNWLEGLVLMVIYVLIALTTWFYPGTNVE